MMCVDQCCETQQGNTDCFATTEDFRRPLVYLPSLYSLSAASFIQPVSQPQVGSKRKHEADDVDRMSTTQLRHSLVDTCISKLTNQFPSGQRRMSLRRSVLLNNMLWSLETTESVDGPIPDQPSFTNTSCVQPTVPATLAVFDIENCSLSSAPADLARCCAESSNVGMESCHVATGQLTNIWDDFCSSNNNQTPASAAFTSLLPMDLPAPEKSTQQNTELLCSAVDTVLPEMSLADFDFDIETSMFDQNFFGSQSPTTTTDFCQPRPQNTVSETTCHPRTVGLSTCSARSESLDDDLDHLLQVLVES